MKILCKIFGHKWYYLPDTDHRVCERCHLANDYKYTDDNRKGSDCCAAGIIMGTYCADCKEHCK